MISPRHGSVWGVLKVQAEVQGASTLHQSLGTLMDAQGELKSNADWSC